MCRSIKTLRQPYVDEATDDDVRAAALQYVRKVSGFRVPSRSNAAAFDEAVAAVTASTRELLGQLEVRPATTRAIVGAESLDRSALQEDGLHTLGR